MQELLTRLKSAIEPAVKESIEHRTTCQTRRKEIQEQIKTLRQEADALLAENKKIEQDMMNKVVAGKPIAACQSRIDKNTKDAAAKTDWANKLEVDALTHLDNQIADCGNKINMTVSKILTEQLKYQSAIAGESFLALFRAYDDWRQAMIAVVSEYKTTGINPHITHRIKIDDFAQQIFYGDRHFWHHYCDKISKDFAKCGSHKGDM